MPDIHPVDRRQALGALLSVGTAASLLGCATTGPSTATSAAVGLPVASAASAGFSPERLARIDQVIGAEIAAKRLPGAAIGVLRRGRLVHTYVGGVLDPTTSVPMNASAIFRAYSMTKPQVTTVAMQLMEEGRLVLTDPVSAYLPALKGLQVSVSERNAAGQLSYRLVRSARDMTVHDLLRHTSGLTYGDRSSNPLVREGYTSNGIELAPFHRPRDGFINALARCPLVAHPSTYFEYGVSTDVLGAVIEVVTGLRLATALEQRLWKPLGMVDTAFWVPPAKQARFAQPFAKDPTDGTTADLHGLLAMNTPPAFDSGGAGSVTTLPDYLRFLQMLLNGGELDGVRILSPASVRLMASDHMHAGITNPVVAGLAALGTPGYSFGLGFGVRVADGMAAVPGSVGEFMWAGTGGTYFWGDPKEQLGVVYMTQRPGASRSQYRRLIKQLTYQAIVA